MQVMSILSIQFLHSNATKFFLFCQGKRKNFEIASYNSQVVASTVSAMPMIYVVKPESSNSNARKRREWSGVLNRPIHYRQNGGTRLPEEIRQWCGGWELNPLVTVFHVLIIRHTTDCLDLLAPHRKCVAFVFLIWIPFGIHR